MADCAEEASEGSADALKAAATYWSGSSPDARTKPAARSSAACRSSRNSSPRPTEECGRTKRLTARRQSAAAATPAAIASGRERGRGASIGSLLGSGAGAEPTLRLERSSSGRNPLLRTARKKAATSGKRRSPPASAPVTAREGFGDRTRTRAV